MPPAITYPGGYVDEMPSWVRRITGVPTAITAFVGRAQRGPVNRPLAINSFPDFESHFGGLCNESTLGFAVSDFFANGGRHAVIVRLYRGDALPANTAIDPSCGEPLDVADFLPTNGLADHKGLYALEQTDLFNLLCIPPYRAVSDPVDVDTAVVSAAATYCEKRRAMLLLDAPKNWTSAQSALQGINDLNIDNVGTRSRNAALFFPRLQQPNPLQGNQLQTFAVCGAVAGVFARTDANQGVWKAPAGVDATLHGVPQLSVRISDQENSELNASGVNCLRVFPAHGPVIWGARTLRGAGDYQYVPVRRTALFIEQSILRGLEWTAFEPNAEPLWAPIRLSIDVFMQSLFQQGAFQGATQREAYFVRCDTQTTPQLDANSGIVNVVVGFAPFRPGEFVILNLQLMVGKTDTQ